PDHHPVSGPNGRMTVAPLRRAFIGDRFPAVRLGVVPAAGTEGTAVEAAPDHHLGAGPHRGMQRTRGRAFPASGRLPAVAGRPVAVACREPANAIVTAPDDHFETGPYGRVAIARRGKVRATRGSPA